MTRQTPPSDTTISDATLRSPEVFAEVARRFYGRVYFTALSIVRQPDTAEDIAQETFLRAWLKRDTITGPALQLQPWLVRIATNLALQWLRTGQQRSRLLPLIPMEEVTVEPVDDTKPDPRQAAGITEQQGQVAEAVMALPTELRQVVLLHYAEGLSPSDIARMNGEAPSTVSRRLDKARAQLRETLESGLATGLAVLKPRQQSTGKIFGVITAAAAIPAATRAQLLQMAADTPPPPLIEAVTSAAHAATMEEAGIMKSIIAKVGAAKLIAGAAAVAAIGGGAYTVTSLTNDNANADRKNISSIPATRTRVTAINGDQNQSPSRARARLTDGSNPRLARAGTSGASSTTATMTTTTTSAALAAAPTTPIENTTSAAEAIAGYVTVRGKVSDRETSEPLVNAIVRAVAPAKDMRDLRKHEDAAKLPSTRTDAAGNYELKVPLPAGAQNMAMDAFYPGYRTLSGTFMSGGDFTKHNIPVSPDQVLQENLNLPKSLYIAGQVVDEAGNPIAGVEAKGTIHYDEGMAFIADASTDESGHFEMFDFPDKLHSSMSNSSGKITLKISDRMTTTIPDVYQLGETERTSVRITMEKGSSLRGQLLFASGEPAKNFPLHIKYIQCNDNERRDVTTDDGGYFHLKGLPEGKAIVYARSMELDQRLKEEITVPVPGDMSLTMLPTPYADTSKAVTLLGMKLIEVTPELAEKYDLNTSTGVLVLNPGPNIQRLMDATEDKFALHEGVQFFMAGDKRITGLNEFVAEIVRINSLPKAGANPNEGHEGYVRVVYNMHRSRSNGSMTTRLSLQEDDVKELEEFLAGSPSP